ncbi:hypothetical protein [Nesterenkonia alkaliphila]|uniref:Uncharacterized protein n=1 Tax=Nesterenkonia alkaliphila TaxID=1463631 RepID=A0A7K1UGX1_9MICC|nr:hypothetical protein [Nesterenkonia alkaliphila]MVT25725.1 hypothetical protein [Nesterenkonia alkaliphila]
MDYQPEPSAHTPQHRAETPASSDLRWAQLPVKPALCEICGRFVALQWHCTLADHPEVQECSQAPGAGFWLCQDLCHPAVHARMEEDSQPGCAARVVHEIIDGLKQLVTRPPYQQHQPARDSADGSTR